MRVSVFACLLALATLALANSEQAEPVAVPATPATAAASISISDIEERLNQQTSAITSQLKSIQIPSVDAPLKQAKDDILQAVSSSASTAASAVDSKVKSISDSFEQLSQSVKSQLASEKALLEKVESVFQSVQARLPEAGAASKSAVGADTVQEFTAAVESRVSKLEDKIAALTAALSKIDAHLTTFAEKAEQQSSAASQNQQQLLAAIEAANKNEWKAFIVARIASLKLYFTETVIPRAENMLGDAKEHASCAVNWLKTESAQFATDFPPKAMHAANTALVYAQHGSAVATTSFSTFAKEKLLTVGVPEEHVPLATQALFGLTCVIVGVIAFLVLRIVLRLLCRVLCCCCSRSSERYDTAASAQLDDATTGSDEMASPQSGKKGKNNKNKKN